MTINLKPLAFDTSKTKCPALLTQCPAHCLGRIFSCLDSKSAGNLLLSCKAVGETIRQNYTSYPQDLSKLNIQILTNSPIPKSEEELSQWLLSSCKDKDLFRFKALTNFSRFSEIPLDCLGVSLIEAAKQGHTDIIQEFKASDRFFEISTLDLLMSFSEAQENNHSSIAEELRDLLKTRLEDPNILAETETTAFAEKLLLRASQCGCLKIVQKILSEVSDISKPIFYEFNRDLLGQSLIEAAKHGQLEIVQDFITSSDFSKISGANLNTALLEAAKHGHLKVMATFLASSRLFELTLYWGPWQSS